MENTIATYNKIASIENIKIAYFDVNKRYTKPHRHKKYLEIVYFTEGEGCHHVDSKRYEVESPVVFIINKEQVHFWEISTIPKGCVIIIKEEFLEKTLDKYINNLLSEFYSREKIQIPKDDSSVSALFNVLFLEMQQPHVQREVVEGALKALLTIIIRYSEQNTSNNENVDKISPFMDLLLETHKNSVTFYVNALNTTFHSLNELCKAKYNKTASQVIAFEIIKEIKRRLLYTDKSVSEIAFNLEFNDVSHFVKYFKRHTGITPLQFKNNKIYLRMQ